jgi:hypothetical protein
MPAEVSAGETSNSTRESHCEDGHGFSDGTSGASCADEAQHGGFRGIVFAKLGAGRAACEQGFDGGDAAARADGSGGDGAGHAVAGDEPAVGVGAGFGCDRCGEEGREGRREGGDREEAAAEFEEAARGEGADFGDEAQEVGGEETAGEGLVTLAAGANPADSEIFKLPDRRPDV